MYRHFCTRRCGAINLRLMFLLVVLCAPVIWLVWIFTASAISGGVVNRGEYLEVDLFKMSNFEMDQVDGTDQGIPKQFRDLDGKRVMLVGEMYQPYAVGGTIAEFDLVYSISKCCVTASPKIQHFVRSTAMQDKQVGYYSGLVRVLGRLHVGVQKVNGRVGSVYRLDVESVKPV
jgi:hypothetical protein